MSEYKPGVIVIAGPTASGKTEIAIKLYEKFKARILSADSMQIYKYMDIGTAKPEREELEKAPHAGIDLIEPDKDFDAANFASMGRKFIEDNAKEGFLTIVAGGTGLYIKALLQGLIRSKPADPEKLEELQKRLKEKGATSLYEELTQKDPRAAQKIHPNDSFRLIRALEFFETTGKQISSLQKEHNFSDTPDYALVKTALDVDRTLLYERINKRVDLMLEKGLEREVRELLEKGYSPRLKSMQSIGYRHMNSIISRELSYEEGIRLMKLDTRRYAKRQLSWFRADPDTIWIKPEEFEEFIPQIEKSLKKQKAKVSYN